jgi:hypothetical protein
MVGHLLTMRGQPSFHTINIHHLSTILSILHSYLTNFEEYGVVVLILSDVSDAVLNLGKQSRDINLLKGTKLDAMFGVLILTWLGTRTTTLPICFSMGISKWLTFAPKMFLNEPNMMKMYDVVRPGLHFVFFNVYTICLLNMYWTKLILGMLVEKLFKKGAYGCDYEGDKSKKTSNLNKTDSNASQSKEKGN